MPNFIKGTNIEVLPADFGDEPDALVKALEEIAAMDPKNIRADDLGRAARIAREALDALVSGTGESK